MRICLVAHGFPPVERTGVENYTAALARELVRGGHSVEVFVPRRAPELPELSLRREERDGYGVNWLTTNASAKSPEEALDLPGVARRFDRFLDRERPELVHFQHVVKLGTGLLESAAEHRIPIVYTAHDYYAVCHRYTLLRPDLTRCDTIGDPEACARCDLALGLLNEVEELGDYQAGVLADQLDASLAQRLAALLEGRPDAAGIGGDEHRAAVARRRDLDRKRADAFALADLVIAPTRFLARALERGGLAPERIRHLPYGIPLDHLRGVPPVRPDADAPVRFGYLGGLGKHKGVHLLLDAFEELHGAASLTVWGYGTDAAYRERLVERASEVGARWAGAYHQDELAACLAEVDVVVAPSTWVENYPIAIREAFAAGRPVITSRVGALPESVRDDVDGLLVEPGDAGDLARALRRCVQEPDLIQRLAAAIEPVKDMRRQADELVRLYEPLVADAARAAADEVDRLPASLRPFAARRAELGRLPSRELFRRAFDGVGRVARAFGAGGPDAAPEPVGALVARALASGSRAQLLLRDWRRQTDWMERTLSATAEAEHALADKVAWLEATLTDRDAALEELRRARSDREAELAARQSECEWLQGVVASRDEEREWLQSVVADKEAALETQRAEHEAERAELERDVAELEAELEALEEMLVLGSRHAEDLSEKLAALLSGLDRTLVGRAPVVHDPPAAPSDADPHRLMQELSRRTRRGLDRLRQVEEELAWRRDEMDAVSRALRTSPWSRLLRQTAPGRRVKRWRPFYADGQPDADEGDGDGGGARAGEGRR